MRGRSLAGSGLVVGAGNLQPTHFVLQGRTLQTKVRRRAARTGNPAGSSLQRIDDGLPLGIVKCGCGAGPRRSHDVTQIRNRDIQFAVLRKNDRTLDEVFQLAVTRLGTNLASSDLPRIEAQHPHTGTRAS